MHSLLHFWRIDWMIHRTVEVPVCLVWLANLIDCFKLLVHLSCFSRFLLSPIDDRLISSRGNQRNDCISVLLIDGVELDVVKCLIAHNCWWFTAMHHNSRFALDGPARKVENASRSLVKIFGLLFTLLDVHCNRQIHALLVRVFKGLTNSLINGDVFLLLANHFSGRQTLPHLSIGLEDYCAAVLNVLHIGAFNNRLKSGWSDFDAFVYCLFYNLLWSLISWLLKRQLGWTIKLHYFCFQLDAICTDHKRLYSGVAGCLCCGVFGGCHLLLSAAQGLWTEKLVR